MKNRLWKYIFKITFLPVCIALTGGCDNTLNPLDEEKGSYSIYGYLDLHEEVNFIRVKDLNKPLTEDSTKTIDATVILENLKENSVQVLQDSVVRFEGVYTHNYRTTMDILPDTRYRVTVERSDGKKASATATTPRIADVTVEPTDENCMTPIGITFEPVDEPNDLSVFIGFRYNGNMFWVFARPGPPGIPDEDEEASDESVYLQFTPLSILNEVFNPPFGGGERVWCNELDTDHLYVRYTHYGPDFYDSSDTTETQNIPGGSEGFGGLYDDSFSFAIDTSGICPPDCR